MSKLDIFFIIVIVISSIMYAYSMFKLIQVDAKSRGMKSPNKMALFLGLNTNSILAYLILRNDFMSVKQSEEDKELLNSYKLRAKIYLCVSLLAVIIFFNMKFKGFN